MNLLLIDFFFLLTKPQNCVLAEYVYHKNWQLHITVAFLADLTCDRYSMFKTWWGPRLLIRRDASRAFVPAGDACRVRPVDGKLAPHPADVQASSTKLYSENGCKPGAKHKGEHYFIKT